MSFLRGFEVCFIVSGVLVFLFLSSSGVRHQYARFLTLVVPSPSLLQLLVLVTPYNLQLSAVLCVERSELMRRKGAQDGESI